MSLPAHENAGPEGHVRPQKRRQNELKPHFRFPSRAKNCDSKVLTLCGLFNGGQWPAVSSISRCPSSQCEDFLWPLLHPRTGRSSQIRSAGTFTAKLQDQPRTSRQTQRQAARYQLTPAVSAPFCPRLCLYAPGQNRKALEKYHSAPTNGADLAFRIHSGSQGKLKGAQCIPSSFTQLHRVQ